MRTSTLRRYTCSNSPSSVFRGRGCDHVLAAAGRSGSVIAGAVVSGLMSLVAICASGCDIVRGGPPSTQARRLISPLSRQPRLVGRLCVVASPIPETQICPFGRLRRCQAERREGACRRLGGERARGSGADPAAGPGDDRDLGL